MVKPSATALLTRERLALAHAALVVIASAWLLGGMGPRGEWIVAALAAPAFALLFAEGRARRRSGDRAGFLRLLRWCVPLAALALYVGVSALNPSHRAAFLHDGYVLRPVPRLEWLPSSAKPADSLRLLACLGALAATGITLAFCVHSRRALRNLVLLLALHALALAVVGTLQQQTGAAGPYFGAVPRGHKAWFATFLYHNHWGAFAVLHAAAALALVFHSLRHPPDRGWQHGPGPLLALVALLLAATAPLSTSRSATALMLVLGLAAAGLALRHLRRGGRARRSRRGALVLLAALGLAVGLVALQSRDILAARLATTREQLAALGSDSATGSARYGRAELYADTWRMISDAPAFGWGLESYGAILLRYSTVPADSQGVVNTFQDAHSDWLQALAELGAVGTALLLALALLPLAETFRLRHLSAFSAWLLGGCSLLAAYAWLEFPFACPAVVATWWILWFAALRTFQLTPATTAAAAAAHASGPSGS